MIFCFDSILLFNLIPNRLHHSTSKVLFSLVCYDCYLSLTLAPLKILVLPDWYLIMMIMMSTMKSQLLALLTFLVVLINWVTSACTPDHNNTTKNVSNASNCEFIVDIMIIIMRYQSGNTNIFKGANVKLK